MGILHLRIGGPTVIDVLFIENLQRFERNLVNVARQASDPRMLREFEETGGAAGFGQKFDVDGLH
jgi:hypothetical protein